MSTIPAREDLRALAAAVPPRTLGVVVFPDFEVLDLCGPLEMFGSCQPAIRPVLVAATTEPVRAAQSLTVVPDRSLADAPDLDMLLIPGGDGVADQLATGVLADWIRRREPGVERILSVCNGAELLAQSGLLDGRQATTNKAQFRRIAAEHPKVRWVAQARWVRDGKFTTSAGVSAGIDMSLDVIADLFTDPIADAVAAYTEYDRHRDPVEEPFADVFGLTATSDGDGPDESVGDAPAPLGGVL